MTFDLAYPKLIYYIYSTTLYIKLLNILLSTNDFDRLKITVRMRSFLMIRPFIVHFHFVQIFILGGQLFLYKKHYYILCIRLSVTMPDKHSLYIYQHVKVALLCLVENMSRIQSGGHHPHWEPGHCSRPTFLRPIEMLFLKKRQIVVSSPIKIYSHLIKT